MQICASQCIVYQLGVNKCDGPILQTTTVPIRMQRDGYSQMGCVSFPDGTNDSIGMQLVTVHMNSICAMQIITTLVDLITV
jgi:hypothetical protein